jgi:hypothetical protein
MGEVLPFDAASRRSVPPQRAAQQMSYETYVAYQQAEAAFRALYFGRSIDTVTRADRPSTKIVQRHWSTVEQLAKALLLEKSLCREQAIKLLLRASLDGAVPAQL